MDAKRRQGKGWGGKGSEGREGKGKKGEKKKSHRKGRRGKEMGWNGCKVGVRGLPERDIWSLGVGMGGGWEIHVSSVVVAAAPGLDTQKGGFVG